MTYETLELPITCYKLFYRLSSICFELVIHVAVACIESCLIAFNRPLRLQHQSISGRDTLIS